MGQIIALESVSQQVLALAVDVDLFGRINGQYIADKIQIAKGYTGLQLVDGDAAVGAKHIIHVQLADTLLRFFLELLRRGCEVGVFVAEQLI